MARTTYKHYDLSSSGRKVSKITAFGGGDYTSPKLEAAPNRAIDLINFVYKNGLVRKRQGYTEVAVVPTVKYIAYPITTTIINNAESKQFNGIWHFLAEDGNYHTVAHIGKVLFEIKELTGKIVTFELLSTEFSVGSDAQLYPVTYEHLNQKSMAFVGNNKLWFLGGNKYMIIGFRQDGRLVYEPVEESQYTYVPTTTINITYANSKVAGRTAFDYANNMTMWRKNTCLSGTGKNEEDLRKTKYYEYTLDGAIRTKNTKEDVTALKENKNISSISNETLRELAKIHITIEELKKEEE